MRLYVNISNVDDTLVNQPSNFVLVESNDYFIFSKGDTNVADGQPIPTSTELDIASEQIPTSGVEAFDKILLADISAGILREIKLQGQNAQYVFLAQFDGETISEPVFELWDNSSFNTINFQILGAGTPANSGIYGIVTTAALPGVSWIGKPLAGELNTNRLLLNGGIGRLGASANLYFNLRAEIKSGLLGALETPKFKITVKQIV